MTAGGLAMAQIERPGATELTLPGRLIVGATVVAGLVVAATSGLGLVFYVPFAVVGGLLAIRRPRLSIGWLLLGVGWAFAAGAAPVDATAADFESHDVPTLVAAAAILGQAAFAMVFILLTTIALVFPSGRLPQGRFGGLARLALAVDLAFLVAAIAMPSLNLTLRDQSISVLVPNPIGVLPDSPIWAVITPDFVIYPYLLIIGGSALSIAFRYRRSLGVERQQLRWLGASLLFVVVAVLFGLALVSLVPATGWGIAWVPAMAAFVSVPVSIFVAVLRYRLYEIDTIINRAIVYGLLTAILAGGSAAMIGLLERAFEGVIGPGSDATILLTTLIVVTAFNPIKARLQTVVDRRFKEVRSPGATLDAFVAEVRRSLGTPAVDRTLHRFLETAVEAYRAPGGELRMATPRGESTVTVGTAMTGDELVASASAGGTRVELRIAAGGDIREADALQPALAAVLAEASGAA